MINNCTKNKSSTDSLKVSLKSELTYFDPQLAEGETSQEILSLLYEPLLDYQILDGQYRFQNLLLTKNPTLSLNSKTISFELKSGVKFSKNSLVKENRDLNADDVIYTILRLADPHLNSPNYWLIERQILGLDEWREKQNKMFAKSMNVTAQMYNNINKIIDDIDLSKEQGMRFGLVSNLTKLSEEISQAIQKKSDSLINNIIQ
jgi:ABC-type transport system substrate-binding protein